MRKKFIRRRVIISMLAVLGQLMVLREPASPQECKPSQIKIAVVHGEDWNGQQTWLGATMAEAEIDQNDRVCLLPIAYRGDQNGGQRIVDIIRSNGAEIVLGPTDSGAYIEAFEKQGELRQFQVPVISSLVTSAEGNQEDGWFFRTNVNNQQRIELLKDALAPLWISSLGVLYADTGFGNEAEQQLRQDLGEEFPPVYVRAPFDSTRDSRRRAVKQILDVRPEAVGIFGLSSDLPLLLDQVESLTKDIPYRPIFFAMVDARPRDDLKFPLYFVANAKDPVTVPGTHEKLYEVGALAYDTMQAVLQTLTAPNKKAFKAADFRSDFVHLLQTENGWSGKHTGMSFQDFQNVAGLQVFRLEAGQVQEVESRGYWERIYAKFELVRRRFGRWPFIYAGLSMALCLVLTIIDVKRKYEGKYLKVFRHLWIYLLCVFHILILTALLLLLGESGAIRYDDYIAILALAVAPTTLFRTTILETQAGSSIGLAKIYDAILTGLNDQILNGRHFTLTRRVAVLAHYNSEKWLMQRLRVEYDKQPDEKQKDLLRKLNDKLKRATKDTEGMERILCRRRIHATRLLRWCNWKDLYHSYVPAEFCKRFPEHPAKFIGSAVDWCASKKKRRDAVYQELKPYLDAPEQDRENGGPERNAVAALRQDIPKDAKDLIGQELLAAIQFLVLNLRYKPADFIAKERGWLDKDYRLARILRLTKEWFQATHRFWRRRNTQPDPCPGEHSPADEGNQKAKRAAGAE